VLLSLYGDYLYTDQLQFGFKDNGCSDALLTVTESVTCTCSPVVKSRGRHVQ